MRTMTRKPNRKAMGGERKRLYTTLLVPDHSSASSPPAAKPAPSKEATSA
jgi:hypothetical protein